MKFPVILILASLAGALVCGQENPSDTAAQEPIDNAANLEAPAEAASQPATVPAEASSDAIQTTSAAENSAENQPATPQKAEPSTIKSSILKTAANIIKDKIEKAEEKLKTKAEEIKEFKQFPRKLVRGFLASTP